VEDILSGADASTGVDWDERSMLIIMAEFIQENCDQKKFEDFVMEKAEEETNQEDDDEDEEEQESNGAPG